MYLSTKELLASQGEFDIPTQEDEQERFEMEVHQINSDIKIDKFLDMEIEQEAKQLKQNRDAIDKALKTYGKLRDVQDHGNVAEMMNYLTQILGLRCISCRKNNISYNTFKFCNFDANVKCYDCQHE